MQPAGLVYERCPAPPSAEAIVEHLWVVRAPSFEQPRREILIPNGRPSVVVCLADPGVRHDPLTGAGRPNRSVMFGVATRPYVLEQLGPSWYVGAQLTPWGVAALLPHDRLVDDVRPLDAWLGVAATRAVEDELRAAPGDAAAAALLAARLAGLAVLPPPGVLRALRQVVATVDATHGAVTVAELARRCARSPAALYRLVRGQVGVAPKQLCEIARYFHFVGGLLAQQRGEPTALLAAMHGYYDQAHAARDFRRFTGVSAGTFREVQHGIARLMHAHDPSKTP